MIVRRRVGMPLLRGAVVGGTAYAIGKRSANNAQREQEQNAAIADLQAQQAAQAQQAQQTTQAQQVAQSQVQPSQQNDVASRLSQLSVLLQQGVLTQDEFAQAKAKILAS
jgi:hypothetical protein